MLGHPEAHPWRTTPMRDLELVLNGADTEDRGRDRELQGAPGKTGSAGIGDPLHQFDGEPLRSIETTLSVIRDLRRFSTARDLVSSNSSIQISSLDAS